MASVAMALCSGTRSSASSGPSPLLCQASVHPESFLLRGSKSKTETLREATTLPRFPCAWTFMQASLSHKGFTGIVTHAVAEILTEEPAVEAETDVPADELSKLKLESDLLKKKAKRAELRRKRLVRKRHLRKKGRWPPSKMAKLKNV